MTVSVDGVKNPLVNSDHVYELVLLGTFFETIFTRAGAPSCDEFNARFVSTGRLQEIFDVCIIASFPSMGRLLTMVT